MNDMNNTVPKEKPNCYQCKYRGTVPGDTHSCCRYPGNDTRLFSFFDQANRDNVLILYIKADKHAFISD